MIDIKADFSGGLNLDDALYNIPKNSYIDALNITRDSIEGSNDKALTNIVGNQLVDYVFPTQSGITTDIETGSVGSVNTADITFSGNQFVSAGYIFNIYLNTGHSLVLAATYTTTETITLNALVLALSDSAIALGVAITANAVNNLLSIDYLNTSYTSLSVVQSFNFSERVVCIGAFPNNVRNTVIYFVWSANGHHLVLEYDNNNRTISPIFVNLLQSNNLDILGFTEHDKITSINVYNRNIEEGEGDLLFFLDSLGRPTTMDILRFKNQEYVPVVRDIINVAKNPPLNPPNCIYGNDTSRTTNSLRDRLFRFKYRYIYDNNEKSTCSPISSVPLPFNILKDNYTNIQTNNNKIDLYFNTGDKDIRAVELLMSYVNKTNDWSDFAVIDTINKNEINFLSTNITSGQAFFNTLYYSSISLVGYVTFGITIKVTINKVLPTPSIVTIAEYTTVDGDTIESVRNELYDQIVAYSATATPPFVLVAKPGNNTINILNNTDYYQVLTTNNVEITYPPFGVDNSNFYYSFYNDSTYPLISIDESIQLFDNVPDLANAQEMPNGNVLMYGGITEGYDRNLVPNVVNQVLTISGGSGVPTGTLNASVQASVPPYTIGVVTIRFTGLAATGTIINIYLKDHNTVYLVGNYTTVSGDTITSIIIALKTSLALSPYVYYIAPTNSFLSFSIQYNGSFQTVWNNIDILQPEQSSAFNSKPTFLFSTQRKIGIAYFDKKGKTNGILYNNGLTFPRYTENVDHEVMLPYINTKIYHQPPEWAYSYNFYLTKETTQFLYWEITDVIIYQDYIYFNISNLELNQKKYPTTTNVLNYTFQDGDRMRLIKEAKPALDNPIVFDDTYDAAIIGKIVNPPSSGSIPEGTYIKIKKFAPFDTVDYSYKFFVIQLYRTKQSLPGGLNEIYYEFGQQYYIGNPTLPTRFHQGMVTAQNLAQNIPAEFNFYEGDVYFRGRTVATSESGIGIYNTLDRNFVDNYISAVNSIDGRPNVIDINAKRAYYSTLVRFSNAYQPNTNINGTNRFFPNNFDEYDYSYGDIMRFKVRDRFIRVFQKLKVGQVPLYHQILKEQNKENLVVSDKLLNPIQYYVGDLGIGENAESLASYNFADYFTSNIKGIIARVSNDGVKYLSIDHKVDSWAWKAVSARTGNYKIYGAFDQILGNYIIALEATDTLPAETIVYNDNDNSFDTYLSYHPEMMVNLGVLFITFKDGKLYTHDSTSYNNFYDVQYDSDITLVFNESPLDKKTFLAVGEVASQIWDVPEATTDVNSYGVTKMQTNLVQSDFAELEGSFEATILRDENSIGGIIDGDSMKGKYIKMKFRALDSKALVSLNLLSLKYINSPLNNR